MNGGEATTKTKRPAPTERFRSWLARRTNLDAVAASLADERAHGFEAWARTMAGVVAFLLALQMLTGSLLAFYYVPSADEAHTTVTYVEKVVDAGSWIRSLHFHGSQWLPVALVLHLAQMLWRGAYRRKAVGWIASVALLALVLAEAATGYTLPWDARAFYSTRVAASIAGGLPLVGDTARAWLAGGAELSTLTLSRFYALHVLFAPFLILLVVVARLLLLRDFEMDAGGRGEPAQSEPRAGWRRAQLARNSLAVALVFVALALCASRWPAPLAPPVGEVEAGYLPRPGAQFLWLFQMLKYLPAPLASLAALVVPGLLLAALAALPFLFGRADTPDARTKSSRFGFAVFSLALLLVVTMTALAFIEDARDATVSQRLSRQAQQEETFRRAPFVPKTARRLERAEADAATPAAPAPPAAYTENCAKCHGAHGEGKSINPRLVGVYAQPRRTIEDLVAIMNDPRSYGLESRMPSFATKLSDDEKRAIAEWIAALK